MGMLIRKPGYLIQNDTILVEYPVEFVVLDKKHMPWRLLILTPESIVSVPFREIPAGPCSAGGLFTCMVNHRPFGFYQ